MSDRIITNGNHRSPARRGQDLCTRDEAAQIALTIADDVAKHLAAQVPQLVGRIVEAALMAYDQSKAEQATLTQTGDPEC